MSFHEPIKLVVVGDGGVGKSCLCITMVSKSFPGEYVPTVFDNYTLDIMVECKAFSVNFFDTAGQVIRNYVLLHILNNVEFAICSINN